MLSAEYVRAVFGRSGIYCLLVAAVGIASVAALSLSALALPLKLALGLALLLSLLDACRQHGLRSHTAAVVSLYGAPETLTAEFRSGQRRPVRICQPLVVTDRCVVMTLQESTGRRLWLPIFADAMDAAAFRRLKVYLTLANHAATGD